MFHSQRDLYHGQILTLISYLSSVPAGIPHKPAKRQRWGDPSTSMAIILEFANDGELSFTNLPNRLELVASKLNIEEIILKSKLSVTNVLIQYSFFLFLTIFSVKIFLFDEIYNP